MIERNQETIMNEEIFNNSLRKFLKQVGITSQREVEKAVRDALAGGRLKGHEKLPAKMVLASATRYQARSISVRKRRDEIFLPLSPCGRGWRER
jgi:hypothetical protein